jgi:hypothetical protein
MITIQEQIIELFNCEETAQKKKNFFNELSKLIKHLNKELEDEEV